jgi:hypothetical protein
MENLFDPNGQDDAAAPGDADTFSEYDYGQLAVHFETQTGSASDDGGGTDGAASVETRCGDAYGIRLAISDSAGVQQVCEESWAPVTVSGDWAGGASGEHLVADCFFVVAPGQWSIDELSATDQDGNALGCCDSTFPSSVAVSESETTEVAGMLQCETVQNGAIDVYVTINTPPTITNVEIIPSKFGSVCVPIELMAEAVDPQGDAIMFSWEVISAPERADSQLNAEGPHAFFAANALGDYEIRLTATDELDASHTLDFPLHLVHDGEDCEPADVCPVPDDDDADDDSADDADDDDNDGSGY